VANQLEGVVIPIPLFTSQIHFKWKVFFIVSRIFIPMVKEGVLHLMAPNLYVKSWKDVCCDSCFFLYIGSCSYSLEKQFCHLLDSISLFIC
jgi:hypothetical protein